MRAPPESKRQEVRFRSLVFFCAVLSIRSQYFEEVLVFLQRDSDVRIWLCRECFSVWIDDAVIVSSNPTCTCRNEDAIGEGM